MLLLHIFTCNLEIGIESLKPVDDTKTGRAVDTNDRAVIQLLGTLDPVIAFLVRPNVTVEPGRQATRADGEVHLDTQWL